ncbi:MAG: phage terminase large subunit family protein [Alphaproteobacteria bacterium]|jgi:phage terminase large subunit GpA-like protein|nr:phage terminase large subunit family protein [Alphaproteobacteria bacterium]
MTAISPKAIELLRQWSGILRPPPKRTTDEWAAKSVELPDTSSEPGEYDPSRTPYNIPIMRAFDDPRWKQIVVVMGSQMGKTLTFCLVIGRRLDDDPVPIMYVGPDRNFVEDTFEPQFMGLLRSSKSLRRKTLWGKAQKKVRKIINGAVLRLAWAGSASQLAGQPAGLVLLDERDRMGDLQGEGDPGTLGDARLNSYANGKLGTISTPLEGNVETEAHPVTGMIHWKLAEPEEVTSPTWALWQEGTRYEWAWPCPHCGTYFVPRHSLLRWSKPADGSKVTPAQARRSAYMVCTNPDCDCHTAGLTIEDSDKPAMNARGRFLAPGQWVNEKGEVEGSEPDTDVASFWVSGLASPFVSWGERASKFVRAVRSGKPAKIQGVINTGFGELYRIAGEAPKPTAVQARRRPYRMGEVPLGGQRLALTVDVQKRSLIYVIRAWGARWESWLVKAGELFGETDQDGVWTDLARILDDQYGSLGISLCLIDYGYRPGDKEVRPTHAVTDFCRRVGFLRARPIRGKSHLKGSPIGTFQTEVRTDGKKKIFGIRGHELDTDVFKSWVHARLRWPADQPGGWHVPEDVPEEYCQQIVAESRIALPSGRGHWKRHGPNHYLDCEMMQVAAANLLQVQTLRPPAEPAATDEPPAPSSAPPSPARRIVRVAAPKGL